ncbi:MAG: hypothetical protein ABJN26_17835 [Stappiaceae bacterium]
MTGQGRNSAPQAVRVLGLEGRYCYLRGSTGQKYLFSEIESDAVEGFPGAVLILAENGLVNSDRRPRTRPHGCRVSPRQTGTMPASDSSLWIGEVDRDGKVCVQPILVAAEDYPVFDTTVLDSAKAYVHLLAADSGARRTIVEDLCQAM